MSETAKTKGEIRIRPRFNPSELTEVDKTKEAFVSIIDQLESLRQIKSTDHEYQRLISETQTRVEDTAMWFVKVLTF